MTTASINEVPGSIDAPDNEPSAEQNENRYDFRAIERKWQARWEETGLFRVENSE